MNLEPEPVALAVVCAYELGGLAGFWPTITSLIRPMPYSMRVGIVAAAVAYLARHFKVV